MSTGPRIPVPVALEIARVLARLWKMDQRLADIWGSAIVGSLRRRGHDPTASVGDIEIISPMPGPEPDRPIATKEDQDAWRKRHEGDDVVYQAIDASLHPPQPPAQAAMFEAAPPPPPPPIGRAIKGLKPCFLACELEVWPAALGIDGPEAVGVQIFRYWPGQYGNRGWIQLMRTGPTELGEWFLTAWKRRYSIPWQQQASAFGFLRDAYGAPVPVPEETATLAKIGVGHIPPAVREHWIAQRTGKGAA